MWVRAGKIGWVACQGDVDGTLEAIFELQKHLGEAVHQLRSSSACCRSMYSVYV